MKDSFAGVGEIRVERLVNTPIVEKEGVPRERSRLGTYQTVKREGLVRKKAENGAGV
jgi:hypothetical protein